MEIIILVGYASLSKRRNGNTAFGWVAGFQITGINNACVGQTAGYDLTSGGNNLLGQDYGRSGSPSGYSHR